jgi:sphinganine-1-phosphate aldolase
VTHRCSSCRRGDIRHGPRIVVEPDALVSANGGNSEMQLSEEGLTSDAVRGLMDEWAAHDVDWRGGRGWSLVYDSPSWHQEVVREAAARFFDENALSHTAFPSAARFESAVVKMVASVVAPDVPAFGVFASGGTESTMIAMKAYRDHARGDRRKIVVPVTAHPAFGKAAAYLGLDLVAVPVDANGSPEPDRIVDAVDDQTLVVGLSAPCYPFGVVDPIVEIAAEMQRRGIGVHVDAALGGLFLPFLTRSDGSTPRFGIDVSGVTSVAVDLHKYGYAAKGASVVLFSTPELRHAAYYVSLGWPGGAYASSGVLGTRSVGTSAAAFAAMATLGRSGYRSLVADVMRTTSALQTGIARCGFTLVGEPPMSVFAGTSGEYSVPGVARRLQERGWWVDTQLEPPAIHFGVFPRHSQVVERFLEDFARAVEDAPAPGAEDDAPLSSYQVMVRAGGTLTDATLREHLDQRFDGHAEA